MVDVLVQFKCGIAKLTDEGLVVADPRRGLVRVVMVAEYQMRLQWLVREAAGALNPTEIDFLIVPGAIESVRPLPSGGRMAELRFKNGAQKSLFFWMQEPDTGTDQHLWDSLSDFTSNLAGIEEDEELEQGPNEGDVEDAGLLAEALSNSSGMEVDSVDGQAWQGGQVQAADLANILANIGMPPPPAASSASSAPQTAAAQQGAGAVTAESLAAILAGMVGQQQPQEKLPSLAEVLTPQAVVPLLQKESVRKRLAELIQYLPPEHQGAAAQEPVSASIEAWRSAPLLNQLRTLSAALQSGQLDYSQFGLQPLGYSAADFLQSIQQKAEEEKSKREK